MGVDDGRHAMQHAVQHRGRGFATGLGAQLDGGVAGGQVVAVVLRAGEAGDADAAGGSAAGDALQQFGAVLAAFVLADEYQSAAGVLRQRRGQEGIEQAVIELGRSQHAEAADQEIAVGQLQRRACGGARLFGRRVVGQAAQQRQRTPVVGAAGTVPLFGQRARELGVHDDAGGLLQHRLVARIGPDRAIAPQFLVAQQAAMAVRSVQRLQERLRLHAVAFHVVEHAAEEEVVQHHHARMAFQQREHVLVGVGIAEVV